MLSEDLEPVEVEALARFSDSLVHLPQTALRL